MRCVILHDFLSFRGKLYNADVFELFLYVADSTFVVVVVVLLLLLLLFFVAVSVVVVDVE